MTQPFTAVHLSPAATEVIAELVVLRALEAAGKRARLPRPCMAESKTMAPHTVHVRFALAHNRAECDRLLNGVWDHLQLVLAADAERLARACDAYVRDLIIRQAPHSRVALHDWLTGQRGAA